MWYNKYVGIPYVEKGRSTEGADCWGLVRLIYKNEYNIDLPSFSDEYIPKDTAHISELVHQYNEGWEKLSTPEEGVGVLFKIAGHASHIGVMIDSKNFIHCIRGAEASIASIDSPRWSKRLEGFYKYTPKTSEIFKAEPSPLAVAPITMELTEGFTVKDAFDAIALNNSLPDRLKSQLILFIDGVAVLKPSDQILNAGQRLEYRLVPADENSARTVLYVGLVVFAAPAAAAWAGSAAVAATGATGLAATALSFGVGAIATMATMAIGMQLINAIFPVRQPDMPTSPGDPGTSNPQLMLTGGRNESRTYGSIPLVLGQYRYIAPLAANTYSQIDTDTVYLRTLLCWGYGDVRVDDVRIGPTVVSEYDEVSIFTDGNTLSADTQTFENIKSIYGTDTAQIYPGVELQYTNSETDWVYRNIVEDITNINVNLHFPEGLRGMIIAGERAGDIFATPFTGTIQVIQLDDNLNEVGSWRYPNSSIASAEFKLPNCFSGYGEYSGAYGTFSSNTSKYKWSRVYILNGVLSIISGPAFLNASSTYVATSGTFSSSGPIQLYYSYTLPTLPTGAVPFLDVQTYSYSAAATQVVKTFKYNNIYIPTGGSYTGGNVTVDHNESSPLVSITSLYSGTLDTIINYGNSGEQFYQRKDAFSVSILFNGLPKGKYKVRARRTNSSEAEPSSSIRLYHRAIFQAITGTIGTAPVSIPKDCSLALTALRIRATDQLNGSIEGVNALVTSVCSDYVTSTSVLSNVSTVINTNVITIPGNSAYDGNSLHIGSTITGHPHIPNGTTILNIATITTTTDIGSGWLTSILRFDITISNNATGSGTSNANILTGIWIKQATRNPASLLRHVLQHPANAQRILDSEIPTKLDLPAFEEWHTYCKSNGFNYDAVLTERRSLLEVMKDVAAAGRASPILSNGKWSVIIDKPRTTVVQQFSPHNSWDFEATKILPTIPHALRVPFVNAKQEFQTEELVVYNDIVRTISATSTIGSPNITVSTEAWANINVGAKVVSSTKIPTGKAVIDKFPPNTLLLEDSIGITTGTAPLEINTKYTSENAELYETISLPGVTDSSACYKHARFHLAQARLRPEFYSINADIEHIVCTRGDLVRVVYDTPMWGIGSSRIDTSNTVADTTTIFFDDPVVLTAGNSYTVRIRSYDGSNSTHVTSVIPSTAEYTSLSITPALTVEQRESGNLILIGEIAKDSAELIVISIEPSSNLTAKLTLVDYSPEVYSSDTDLIPEFNTKITRPSFTARNFITLTPVINVSGIKSDESVMTLSAASYVYKIRVPFNIPSSIPSNITHIETRYCLTNDTSKSWRSTKIVPIATPNLYVEDVIDQASYSIQSRYVSSTGFSGPWTGIVDHVVVGKTNPPATVASLTKTFLYTEGTLLLNWSDNLEIDVTGYEVRTTNSGWGTPGYIYKGKTSEVRLSPPAVGVVTTYYVKAIDAANLYSVTAASVEVTRYAPNQTYGSSITYSDTSLTTAQLHLTWDHPTPSTFVVNKYRIVINKPGKPSYTVLTGSDGLDVTADWGSGDMTFSITCIDITGAESVVFNGANTKWKPNPPTSINTFVDINGLNIAWSAPSRTTLPVLGYEIRDADSEWGTTLGRLYSGSSSRFITNQLNQGINTRFIRTYDTDNVYSNTVTATFMVNPPAPTTFNVPMFSDTSLTTAEVRLSWLEASPQFGLKEYELSYDSTIVVLNANTITVQADWLGDRIFNLRVKDKIGGVSSFTSLTVTKQLPNPVALDTFRTQVIDNNVLLFWEYPTKTTLPISHARIKRGASWAGGKLVGDISGTFSQIFENKAGTYTYWIAVVDTDNNESTPISISSTVNSPPDYVFNAEYTLNLATATKIGAVVDNNKLVLPVNTTEDWSSHFSTRGWASPNSQVLAGYPIYAQPCSTSGSISEVFDYGTLLASSQINLDYTGTILSGTPVVSIIVSISADNVTYVDYTSLPVFGTNFRYVKVTFTVNSADSLGLYVLDELSVRLDSKQKTDAGTSVFLDSTSHPNGTIINFGAEFIDVSSINLTPSGTSALTTAYDFRDQNLTGTYSATGTTCTLTETGHGFIAGQKVKLYFSSGNALNGVYTVSSVTNANTYVVNMNVVSPTSGTHTSYPNSCRGYMFNPTNGARVTGTVSWNVRGY